MRLQPLRLAADSRFIGSPESVWQLQNLCVSSLSPRHKARDFSVALAAEVPIFQSSHRLYRLVFTSTFDPGTNRTCPSVTTSSPGFTPSLITDSPLIVRATFTTRDS